MLVFAAIALGAQPVPAEAAPARQARAVVRIIRGDRLRFAEIEKREPERLRFATIRATDGSPQRARLIEFE